jgi:hypothetical protein
MVTVVTNSRLPILPINEIRPELDASSRLHTGLFQGGKFADHFEFKFTIK